MDPTSVSLGHISILYYPRLSLDVGGLSSTP